MFTVQSMVICLRERGEEIYHSNYIWKGGLCQTKSFKANINHMVLASESDWKVIHINYL